MARIRNHPLKYNLSFPRSRGAIAFFIFTVYLLVLMFTEGTSHVVLPQDDAPLFLYSNQADDNLRLTLKAAIDSAKESIRIAVYSLTDDTLISALRNRAREGVQVHIITDKDASPKDLGYRLGDHIVVERKQKQGLMHHKIMVIDHKEVWLGSTNYTRESLLRHGNILVGVSSRPLAQYTETKLSELLSSDKTAAASATLPCHAQEIALTFLPDDTNAVDEVVQLIKSAKKTVRVAMYTFTHSAFVQALEEAHKRGVDVEVVFDQDSSKQTSRFAFKKLQDANIKVLVNSRPGLLHYKMMIVDEETLIAGSANWTKAAFQINNDNILKISPLLEEQREKINTLWNNIVRDANRVNNEGEDYASPANRIREDGKAHPPSRYRFRRHRVSDPRP